MNEPGKESLAERVERLEKDVEEVRDELRQANEKIDRAISESRWSMGDAGTTPASPEDQKSVPWSPSTERRDEPRGSSGAGFRLPLDLGDFRSGEWWLNKVGIGLLLFGVAFLYLLSVERGWISPPVRVAFGLAIGAALLTIGLRVFEDRIAFAQVLLGGGIGAFYITGFAAFQLYALVPYPVAFGFMVAVTLLASSFSLRQNEASLSLIGSIGGLGTPFILYNGSESLVGLVLYACIILAGTGAIYFYKGWASLLGVSFTGGWMVLLIGLASSSSDLSTEDQRILQLGVTFTWLLFWLAPVVREILYSRNPAAWSLPMPGPGLFRSGASAHLMSVITAPIALAFTQGIWSFQQEILGWIAFGGTLLYALVALALGRAEGGVARTQALVALMLLTLALVLVLEGNALLFTLAAEGAVLHLVAHKLSDRIISGGAHFLFFVAATWLGVRLASDAEGFHTALVDIGVMALAFGVSPRVVPRFMAGVYRIVAHAAFLAFLWRELSVLPGGDAYVTIAWGLYAAGLFVVGLRLDSVALVRCGMATFFLVVGKLFLVDLAQVDTVWRVLLFLGFGGLFLALSYYLRSLWRPGTVEDR